MSKENVEAIRLTNEAFNRGDLDEALAPHHPEYPSRAEALRAAGG